MHESRWEKVDLSLSLYDSRCQNRTLEILSLSNVSHVVVRSKTVTEKDLVACILYAL